MKNKKLKIDPISLFSHELKTPLSSLKLGLNLLQRDFQKHKNIIKIMDKELDKMVHFITDNLDLRLIQKKTDLFQWKWGAFETLLFKTCSSLKLIAQEENIQFDIKKPEEKIELFMDSSWFTCLLNNLLSNAIQYSPKNSKIFIEYFYDSKKGFVFSIQNKEISDFNSKKVFELFYKGAQYKKGLKNTGLGLAIVKAIVEAHKGEIKAFSKSQKIRFCFVLPQARLLKKKVA